MARAPRRNPFANPDEEENIARSWLCTLHHRWQHSQEVQHDGMKAEDIYQSLHLEAATGDLRDQRIDWLINNCLDWGLIRRLDSGNLIMTDRGNHFCLGHYCHGVVLGQI